MLHLHNGNKTIRLDLITLTLSGCATSVLPIQIIIDWDTLCQVLGHKGSSYKSIGPNS